MTDQPNPPSQEPPPAGPPGAIDPRTGPEAPLGCTPSLEELFRYMDGYLDPVQKTHLQAHLDGCGGCGQLYDLQASFRHLVGRHCQTEAPPDLADRIFGAIPDLRLPPRRHR